MAQKKKSKIKVVLGSSVRREATLISIDGAVLGEGTNSRQIVKKVYGR